MDMNLHPNRYFYKISKNFLEIGKNQPFSCPYIIEGLKQNRNRGDYYGKGKSIQLFCGAG